MSLVFLLARIVALALAVLVPGWLLARAITGRTDSPRIRTLAPTLGLIVVPATALAIGLVFRMPWRWPLVALSSALVTLCAVLLLRRQRG